jgi:hypothetical protein
LVSDSPTPAAPDPIAAVLSTPAVQALQQRLEKGGVFPAPAVSQAAQPFLAVLLRRLFSDRPLVVVTDSLRTQEAFHQDVQTWLQATGRERHGNNGAPSDPRRQTPGNALFYPGWEILPHEARLPHADVISERLETLVALSAVTGPDAGTPRRPPPLIVTSVAALLQRTFAPDMLRERTRVVRRGDRIDPLDLVEWLEDQAYEPEVQVNHKGEIALRGGILDIFPLTSPWPVRLEFFGDELESIRCFDPASQMSREEILEVPLPPGGELGILKQLAGKEPTALATLAEHLPPGTIVLWCEPDALDEHARDYAAQVPPGDRFFIPWVELQSQLRARRVVALHVSEAEGEEEEGSGPESPDFGSPPAEP